jgi:hypothetical protein
MTYRKKLIEVALPLDAINKASAREKSIRHGHPRHAAPMVGEAAAGDGAGSSGGRRWRERIGEHKSLRWNSPLMHGEESLETRNPGVSLSHEP